MEIGTHVATKYLLTERLGQGATGVVFAARHEKTGNEVALKIVAPHRAHQRRALREARAACAVEHPNLVPIWDILEEEDGTTILVMARLRGTSLRARLAEGRMSARETTDLAEGIFAGLGALHRAGVVHRDLKPDNVFLVAGEEPLAARVRILDFGIAKLAPDATQRDETALTESGAMLGTPKYMAPEQAFGEADVDARADLWAAGAVLYECLTGALPAPGDNLGQIMKRLAQGAIVPLSEHDVEVPEPLRGVVEALLVVDRAKRLASAEDALARLQGVVAKARPESEPAPKPKRAVLPWIAGAAVAAGVVGVVAVALRHDDGTGPVASASASASTSASAAPSADVPVTRVAPSATATTSAPLLPTTSAKPPPRPTAGVPPGPSASPSASASAQATTRILDQPPF